MTTGAEAAGGNPENGAAQAPIPHPVDAARAQLYQTMELAAQTWAPDAASASWEHWAEAVQTPPENALPGLIRIGTTTGNTPVLTPLLGETHLIIGDHNLLTPTKREKVTTKQVTDVARLRNEAAARYQETESARIAALQGEQRSASAIARGVITRTLASMPPGTVDVTIYDPLHHGRVFSPLAPLGRTRMVHHAGNEDLAKMLDYLNNEVNSVNLGALDGHQSLRHQILANGSMSRPWRLVVLLGHEQELDLQNAARLENILTQGAKAGISLIVHGLPVPDISRLSRLRLTPRHMAKNSATGGLEFQLDETVPAAIMNQAAATSARKPFDGHASGKLPDVPPQLHLATAARRPLTLSAGSQYARLVRYRTDAWRTVYGRMRSFNAAHPALNAESLQAYAGDPRTFLHLARTASADPTIARQLLDAPEAGQGDPAAVRLQAWALVQLMARTPGHARAWLTEVTKTTLAPGNPENAVPPLIDLVRTTRGHGTERIPEEARDYLMQYLPDQPPAYVFQLVSDLAVTAGSRLLGRPHAREAEQAVAAHLQAAYGQNLYSTEGQPNRPLLRALAECELLRLYDFPNATPELQVLLAQHAHERLAGVRREDLPLRAQPMYDRCTRFLEQQGGPVPSAATRAVRGLGSLISSGTAAARQLTSSRKDTDTTNAGAEGAAPVRQPQIPQQRHPAADPTATRESRQKERFPSGPVVYRPNRPKDGPAGDT